MTVTANDIMATEVAIGELTKRVRALVSPPLPFARVVDFNPAVSATFLAPSQTQQQPTWVNGGGDFWLCGLGYQAWTSTYSGTTRLTTFKLHDSANGLGYSDIDSRAFSRFDFQWNMTKQENATGRQVSYVSAPGALNSLLSHTALGNQETNRHLTFRPWKIAHGDSVFFTLKPIGYFWSPLYGFTDTSIVTITMTMYGFRVEAQR